MKISRPMPTRRRGVAVVTALLLTTLAVSIVASLFWQQQVQVRTMENQRLQLQTKWIQRGALDWAMLVLTGSTNLQYTSLDQPWATPLAETRLDEYVERERVEGERYDATLSGNITDACARYNLTNLAENRQMDDGQIMAFGRLLTNLQMDSGLARRVAQYVAAGQSVQVPVTPDGDQLGTGTGTGTGTGSGSGANQNTSQITGVQGTPMPFVEIDDLLSVPGFTPAMVERLRPFVVVLPLASKVNVNTAAPEVLAAMVRGMSVSEANAWAVRRKQAPWISDNMFERELQDSGKAAIVPQGFTVKSDWYLVNSRIRLDRAALDAESLIRRSASPLTGGTQVVWIRQY
nr:type II secretion system minor pseudopilin GspK [uncultured Massilia sp.]